MPTRRPSGCFACCRTARSSRDRGRRIPLAIDTICVHGDEPSAVAMARAIRAETRSQRLRDRAFHGWATGASISARRLSPEKPGSPQGFPPALPRRDSGRNRCRGLRTSSAQSRQIAQHIVPTRDRTPAAPTAPEPDRRCGGRIRDRPWSSCMSMPAPGAIILAHGVDRVGIRETPAIFGERRRDRTSMCPRRR